MTAPPEIRIAGRAEEARVAKALAHAFDEDPVSLWIWPDPAARFAAMAESVGPYGARALDLGTGFVMGDFAAVALWLPPGETLDGDGFERLLERTVRQPARGHYLEQAARLAAHRPATPHWYLALVGVVPEARGRGHGGALLAKGLALADRDRLPVYLESSNPANLGLYRRQGFEVAAEARCGGSPPKYALIRPAR